MAGHIKLGKVDEELTDYVLYPDIEGGRVKTLVNPMSSKISQGGTEYEDQENWSYWTQSDWQPGSGQLEPRRKPGFLYGDAETRVPQQIILPQVMRPIDTRDLTGAITDCRFVPGSVTGTKSVGSSGGQDYHHIAVKFTTPAAIPAVFYTWFLAHMPFGASLIFQIWSNVADAPGASIGQISASPFTFGENPAGFYWYGFFWTQASDVTLVGATSYWLVVISSGGNTDVAYGTGVDATGAAITYARTTMSSINGGTTWQDTGLFFHYLTSFHAVGATHAQTGAIEFNSVLYVWRENAIYKYNTTNGNLTSVGTAGSGNITAAVVADKLYLAKASGDFYTMTTGEVIAADPDGDNATLFVMAHGLIWRADGASLYYSDDGDVWQQITDFPADYTIRGMAPLGNDLYVGTDRELIRVSGSAVKTVTEWGAVSAGNGRRMIHHAGNIYTLSAGRVLEITEAGTIRDIWAIRDDDLTDFRPFQPQALGKMNNWLVALVTDPTQPSFPALFAYQGDAWHHLMTMPFWAGVANTHTTARTIYYDRTTSLLWCVLPIGMVFACRVPDVTLNPYHDSNSRYQPYAWMEWDWFDGDVIELNKDFDSVTIIGENFTANRWVKVYWKDDASTTWELLGTFDSNNETIKWDDFATRPRTKRFKMGILLYTNDSTETPRIQHLIVRFQTHLKDRWRWNMTIITHDNQIGMDNRPLPITERATLDATLEQLIGTDPTDEQTAPLVLEDTNDLTYLVKVVSASHQMRETEVHVGDNSTKVWASVYTTVFEQSTPGLYTP